MIWWFLSLENTWNVATEMIQWICRVSLTLSWRRPLSYRNQSMDWFLYDNGLRHERVKLTRQIHCIISVATFQVFSSDKNHHINSLETITYSKSIIKTRFSYEKLTFLTPWLRTRTCADQGVRYVTFLENSAHVLNEWLSAM